MSVELICDLDGVLLNTRHWIRDFKDLLVQCGATTEQVTDYYENSETHKPYRSRTMYLLKHPDRLKDFMDVKDCAAAEQLMQNHVSNMRNYLFPDAIEFLERFRSENLILATSGAAELQDLKIKHTGIATYFKQLIIAWKERKPVVMKEFHQKGQIQGDGFFIDNTLNEIKGMKAQFPELTTILVDRWDRCDPLVPSDHLVTDLGQAASRISQKS